jgi:hypothetical protein
VHDLAVDGSGRLVFVATLFGFLATLSHRYSFTPLWRPPFVSKLAAEDRCHLNGLALEGGRPCYVTAVSRSDVVDGWRDRRRDGTSVYRTPRGLRRPVRPASVFHNLIVPGSGDYEDWVLGPAAKGIPVGKFLADVVNFLIVAFTLFIFIVKFLGWVLWTRKEETAAPPPLTKDQELLTETRDLLRRDGQPVRSEDLPVVKGANVSG